MVVVTPSSAGQGFRLAGIDQASCAHGQLRSLLKELIVSDRYSFIIVDERLLDKSGEAAYQEVDEQWEGVIVVLPPPSSDVIGEEDYIARLIRKAIGYHVRLEE